jgi:UDP-perosamine 4-acetyltransferase
MKLVLVGGGGHGRSVLEAVRTGGLHEVVSCTDPRPELAGTELDGIPILGDDSLLPGLLGSGVRGACIGVGGTHDNGPRSRLFEHVAALGFELPLIVHGSATVAGSAEIGHGSVILATAVVGPGARIAENVVVNTGAVVEHDGVLEAHVHLATGAVLGGGVTVERLAHVGLGASVIHGVRIGAEAIVGAGSVVIRDVQSRTSVAGCPAVPLQTGR